MYVRSFIKCPLCGKEMRMMSGAWYYSYPAHLITIDCRECNLEINEYDFDHKGDDPEQTPYEVMVERLKKRILDGGLEEVEK